MPELTLRQAVAQARTSKSSLLRAIRSGQLSARREDDDSYRIDAAELSRVYPEDRVRLRAAAQNGAGSDGGGAADAVQWRIRAFEVELKEVRARLEAELRRVEEIRQERDSWKTQAERLLLAAPILTTVPPVPNPTPPNQTNAVRLSWWRWLLGAS